MSIVSGNGGDWQEVSAYGAPRSAAALTPPQEQPNGKSRVAVAEENPAMRWCWSWPVAAFIILAPLPSGSPEQAAADTAVARPTPPMAARKPVRLTNHGIERVDDYAWLRDPNWRKVIQDPSELAPEIRAHIDAENDYAEAVLAPLSDLRARLIAEMKGRIEQDESGVPTPDGQYAYWRKFLPGAEHPRIVRAPRAGGAEQVLLDGPRLAAGKPYFSFGETHHSPDHRLYAYTVDETGSETYDLRIRNIRSGRDLPDVISEVASFAWAQDSRTLFYVRLDEDHRPRFVYRHRLGTDPAERCPGLRREGPRFRGNGQQHAHADGSW